MRVSHKQRPFQFEDPCGGRAPRRARPVRETTVFQPRRPHWASDHHKNGQHPFTLPTRFARSPPRPTRPPRLFLSSWLLFFFFFFFSLLFTLLSSALPFPSLLFSSLLLCAFLRALRALCGSKTGSSEHARSDVDLFPASLQESAEEKQPADEQFKRQPDPHADNAVSEDEAEQPAQRNADGIR